MLLLRSRRSTLQPNYIFRICLNNRRVVETCRKLSTTPSARTDGVYKALTDMRVRIPWIEALKNKAGGGGHSSPTGSLRSTREVPKPKKMSESHYKVVIPLARDPWLSDMYLNASGHLRLGAVFMDLDALSGIVAYRHTGDHVMTVTAACDRIIIQRPLEEICDIELSGQVTFATGRSSMEISMQVARAPADGISPRAEDILMTCAFTMVSLDPYTKKPVSVNPLRIQTDEERNLFKRGEENYKKKKLISKMSLLKQPPTDEERAVIHAMWLENRSRGHRPAHGYTSMASTEITSSQIMQPQYRNRHNFMIFGGFLLKQTFELAFSCCASFARARPTFLSLDPSTFDNPVPVGSELSLSATVAFTETDHVEGAETVTKIHIMVDSKVREISESAKKQAGQFHYTFLVEGNCGVVPETYEEYMIWLDARRRANQVVASLSSDQAHQLKGAHASFGNERVIE